MFEPSRVIPRRPVHKMLGKHRIRPVLATVLMLAAMLVASLAFVREPTRASTPLDTPTTTIVVNSLLDLPDPTPADGTCNTDGAGCTLRAAIQTAQGGAWSGPDTIDLSGLSGTIFMSFGVLPAISEDLTISGPAIADTLRIDATSSHQHMTILPGVTVEIARVFLTNGSGGTGGSIYNQGLLTLTGVIIANSSAIDGGALYSAAGSTTIIRMDSQIGIIKHSNSADYGGAIYADGASVFIDDSFVAYNGASFNGGGIHNDGGTVTIENQSVIEGNGASSYGGGIYNDAAGVIKISDSTISNNSAGADGGGVYNVHSTQTLLNTTISRNTAHGYGGGIAEVSPGATSLYNVTVTDNIADSNADGVGDGGGLFANGLVNISNSILAGNQDFSVDTDPILPDCTAGPSAIFSTNTYNLVGIDRGCAAYFVNGVSGNQVGTALSPLDPVLGPLDWGSSGAWLHALLAGSPAIDSGDPTGCKDEVGAPLLHDQRDMVRPQNARCDIGAYEAAWPIIDDQGLGVPESAPNGTVVGTVAATDPNSSSPLAFAITGGNGAGAGAFAIGEYGGVLTVADSSQLIFATNPVFNLDVVVTNTIGLTDTGVVTVDIIPSAPSGLVVLNTNDSGPGSLRNAMLTANAQAGPDTITFAIDGAGPHIIRPTSSLPPIVDPVTINGTTQPVGSIEVDGSLAGPNVDGFLVLTYDTTIRGLTIRNFTGAGVLLDYGERSGGSGPNVIENNTITGNGKEGVLVSYPQQATIRRNSIYNNGLLGIDLGGNGVTPNDVGDPDVGPNLYQNYPVLLRASRDQDLAVDGRLNSLSNLDFTLEFFASTTCDPTGFGEGQRYLSSKHVATDAAGNARFAFRLPPPPPVGYPFITATATDENGNTSEFSQCIVVGPNNDSWPRAYRLNPAMGDNQTVTFSQYVDKLSQSRWYKFQVEPDSMVTIELSNLPVNYDIVIYKDIAAVYQALTTPQSQTDLQKLNAEFAPDMYSPDMYSPDMYSPDMYSPDMYSPDMYSPDMYSPDMYSPDVFAPDMYSPDMYSPDMYSPDMYSPDEHAPNAFDPSAFDPNAPVPDSQAYASAQNRSIIAFSSRTGTADERAIVNTWTRTGDFYVRVRGRNGVYSLASPFTVNVTIQRGMCQNLDTTLVPGNLPATSGNFHTVILVDPTRMIGSPAAINAMLAKLAQLAARPEVQGVVVNVSQDARVAAANLQADQKVECPEAKNLVADATRQIVQHYRDLNPLEYVVIAGNDNAIPFFRTPDQAMLASEVNYIPPVFNATQSQSSLRLGYVLTQDPYGSAIDISFKNHTIPVPDLAVGRLVETPAEVMHMVDAYLVTNGGVVSTPSTAFVSGYDFLTDAAEAVQAQLESGIGQPASTLIAPRGQAPQDPLAWTGAQLKAQFLGSRHDLNFLAGHFSAATALAADYTTRMTTQDVLSSTVNLENALVFSAGCHSGYNIVNADAVPNVTREPDWAQTFARKGATLIAGTGYQYGDTDFVEYSERLYLEFAKHLRYGVGPVPVGKALVGAKQTYLENTARMRGIHEKSVLEATLFGLPMLKVNLPFGRTTPPVDPPAVTSVSGYSSNPGLTLGLKSADITITPNLTQITRVLSNTTALSQTISVTYLEGSNGLAINPVEPVLPLETRNVTVAGEALRGIGFRGGVYTDQGGVVPLTSAPATEIRGIHFPFRSQTFYPIRAWDANYFDALANPSGGTTKLIVMPAQFRANDLANIDGTLRKYNAMDFRLFYSDNVASYPESNVSPNVPSIAAPPEIAQVTSITDTNTIAFTVRVTSDPSVGVQEVWVTYTGAAGPFYGSWQSLDLSQDASDSTVWNGVLSLPPGQTWNNVRFVVQAVNGVGLVTLVTNFGNYFIPGIDPGQTPSVAQASTLTLISPPVRGPYGTPVTFTAQLQSATAPTSGIPGQVVEFSYGSQRRQAVTNASGMSTVSFPLVGLVGSDVLQATYAGNETFLGSSASSIFTIDKQRTSLTLTPQPANGQYSDDPGLQTTLIAGADRRLPDKTVFVVAGTPGGTLSATSSNVTDYAGRAPAGSVNLPAGTYPLTAYFLGAIPIGGGQTVTLVDSRFIASTGAGTLIQTAEDATVTYTGQTSIPTGAGLNVAALVVQADDGMPGDLALASVEYVVRNTANQVVATVTGSVSAGGVSSATVPGLANGAYTLTVQVVGGYFASPVSAPIRIQVGSPTAVALSGLDAGPVNGNSSLPWLIAWIMPGLLLAAWLKRRASMRRNA